MQEQKNKKKYINRLAHHVRLFFVCLHMGLRAQKKKTKKGNKDRRECLSETQEENKKTRNIMYDICTEQHKMQQRRIKHNA